MHIIERDLQKKFIRTLQCIQNAYELESTSMVNIFARLDLIRLIKKNTSKL